MINNEDKKKQGMSRMDKISAASQIYSQMQGAGGGSQGDAGGALSGAASGAMAGAQFGGAPGALVGGATGALMGIAKSRAARKAHNAQVESQKIQQQGQIEKDKQDKIANALGMMGQRMSLR